KAVLRSTKYILLAYGVNFLLVLVLGIGLARTLNKSFSHSVAAENMRNGFDSVWYQAFSSEAHGLTATFHPSVVGIGAVFNGLEQMLDGRIWTGLAAGGFLYVLLWTFWSAGFIGLYATSEEHPSFFQRAAEFFPRFLILAVLAGVAYFLLFYFVMQWLGKAVEELTRETIDERVHFLYVALKYLVAWVLIGTVNLVIDYSKILTVVRNHKNALSAPLVAVRLVFSNFGKTYGLYLSIGIVWTGLMLLYWLVAPGAGQSSWLMIIGTFVVSQIYLLTRIATRCLFYAGQTVMFELLHCREELVAA
ncbi:MAG: hypothetical protein ACE5G1_17640, partial [bacterium]